MAPSMSRSTAINGAGAPSRMILRHVRGNSHTSTLFHKTLGIESFVSAHGGRLLSRNLFQHHQCGVTFCRPVGLEDFRVYNQSITVFHQKVSAVTLSLIHISEPT